MKLKEESEKVGLKLKIQKTKFMASGPITSWQIDGEKVETVKDFIILGSKITVNSDCSHKVKTHAPWKKSYHQPADLTYMQRASWEMLGWMNRKLESRLQGETSTTQLCR